MRYPRIYDLNLRRTGELRTAEITDLKLKDTPLSCVTVTVPMKDIGSAIGSSWKSSTRRASGSICSA